MESEYQYLGKGSQVKIVGNHCFNHLKCVSFTKDRFFKLEILIQM